MKLRCDAPFCCKSLFSKSMIKSLWLTSWYPNALDAMNGDFIQRHARAAALFCKVDVIHLEADTENKLESSVTISQNTEGNLSETTVLYKPATGITGKIASYFLYQRLFKQQIKKYITANGLPDVVHVHVPVKAGLLALWIKKKYKIPYAVTEHWAIYNHIAADAYPKRNFLFKYFTKRILQQADIFLPVSKNLGENIQQMVLQKNFTAIPNVADTSLFNYTEQKPTGHFQFIHVSTLKKQKNPEGLLRAFAALIKENAYKHCRLLIAGESNDALNKYYQQLFYNNEHVAFTGLLPYAAVAAKMKESQALVMFSRFENLPCVIIEALCCGLPVISTNVGGIPEMIDESYGLLLNNEDEAALLNAMKKLVGNYKNYDCRFIAESAAEKYNYQKIGRDIADCYEHLKTIVV